MNLSMLNYAMLTDQHKNDVLIENNSKSNLLKSQTSIPFTK